MLAKALGATQVTSAGAEVWMLVEDEARAALKISVDAGHQRVMATLTDGHGIMRNTVDVAPVSHVREDPAFPGRVALHVGTLQIRIERHPTLAIQIVSG